MATTFKKRLFNSDVFAAVIVHVAKAAYYTLIAAEVISFVHTSKLLAKGLVRVDVRVGISLT